MRDNMAYWSCMSAPCPQPLAEPALSREVRRFTRPGRTREGQAAKRFRADLIRHVGGAPSVVQAALIEQAVQLKLRLGTMDRQFARHGGLTEHDSRTYLAWSNSLARLVNQLGIRAAAERPPSLADILAAPPSPPPRQAAGGALRAGDEAEAD